jgi:FMN reductase
MRAYSFRQGKTMNTAQVSFILAIAGSPTTPSRTSALMTWAADYFARADLRTQVLNVRDLDAGELLHGRYDGASVRTAAAQVSVARAIVLATPVYKAAYTGTLKTFLDLLPGDAFADKVVLPVAIGGSAAHSLAVDYALRPLCAALGAYHVLPGLYLVDKSLNVVDGTLHGFVEQEAETRTIAALDSLIAALK